MLGFNLLRHMLWLFWSMLCRPQTSHRDPPSSSFSCWDLKVCAILSSHKNLRCVLGWGWLWSKDNLQGLGSLLPLRVSGIEVRSLADFSSKHLYLLELSHSPLLYSVPAPLGLGVPPPGQPDASQDLGACCLYSPTTLCPSASSAAQLLPSFSFRGNVPSSRAIPECSAAVSPPCHSVHL